MGTYTQNHTILWWNDKSSSSWRTYHSGTIFPDDMSQVWRKKYNINNILNIQYTNEKKIAIFACCLMYITEANYVNLKSVNKMSQVLVIHRSVYYKVSSTFPWYLAIIWLYATIAVSQTSHTQLVISPISQCRTSWCSYECVHRGGVCRTWPIQHDKSTGGIVARQNKLR